MGPGDHAERYIRETRCVAVAMLEAKGKYPAKHEREQVLVGELRCKHSLRENIQNVEYIRIGDHGKINEFADLPRPQPRPDLFVLLQYLFIRGMGRPVFSAPSLVFDASRGRSVSSPGVDLRPACRQCDRGGTP